MNHDIDTLIIEATRNCTQRCEHCLRGDAEDLCMSSNYLQKLFEQLDANQVDYIDNLTISGGEPLLNPEVIDDCVRLMELYGIQCGNFYIATGAHDIPMDKVKKAISSIANLYAYCDDNECSAIHISNDQFHINDCKIVRMLKVFSFIDNRNTNGSISDKALIAEGRLDDNSFYKRKASMFDLPDEEFPRYSIYFNVLGDLIPGCDFSYEHQEKISKMEWNVIQTESAVENYINYIQSLMVRAKEKAA